MIYEDPKIYTMMAIDVLRSYFSSCLHQIVELIILHSLEVEKQIKQCFLELLCSIQLDLLILAVQVFTGQLREQVQLF